MQPRVTPAVLLRVNPNPTVTYGGNGFNAIPIYYDCLEHMFYIISIHISKI